MAFIFINHLSILSCQLSSCTLKPHAIITVLLNSLACLCGRSVVGPAGAHPFYRYIEIICLYLNQPISPPNS